MLSNGGIADVYIPKMSLDINKIECEIGDDYDYYAGRLMKFKQVFVKDGFEPDEDIIITIKECEMTKEQIEKELGYKIKIKE